MSLIPPPPQFSTADVHRWAQMKVELNKLKFQEQDLRKRLFGFFFSKPEEGTNKYALPDGYVLKATHCIDRKVDVAQLASFSASLVRDAHPVLRAAGYQQDQINAMNQDAKLLEAIGVSTDKLIKYKPELSVTEYRKLTAEQAAVVNMFIDSKPGSPQVELVPSAELKAQLETAAAPTAYVPPPPRFG